MKTRVVDPKDFKPDYKNYVCESLKTVLKKLRSKIPLSRTIHDEIVPVL
jgi:hypothetical protein